MSNTVTYINEEEVKKLLDWDSTYSAVYAAIAQTFNGNFCQPARCVTSVNDVTHLYSMPGYLDDPKFGSLACKLVTTTKNRCMPNVRANIILFSEETGELQAVIAATEITAWRTAAASVVATKVLARKTNVLAIIGAGVQGRIHALAFAHFFHIQRMQIWNRSPEKAERLVHELQSLMPDVEFICCRTIQSCLHDANVIVTATNAAEPIIQLDWIPHNAHINSVGVTAGKASELELNVYHASSLYVDHYASAQTELAHIIADGVQVAGELGELLHRKETLVNHQQRCSVFQSLGMAVEDCAMARLIYNRFMLTKH